jgi:hypothetical protein
VLQVADKLYKMLSDVVKGWVVDAGGAANLTEETTEYILSVATDADTDAEELLDLLHGLHIAPNLQSLSREEQIQCSMQLVERVTAKARSEESMVSTDASVTGTGNLDTPAVVNTCAAVEKAVLKTSEPFRGLDHGRMCKKHWTPALLKLREIAPGVEQGLLSYVLYDKNMGDLHNAAQYILEHDMESEKTKMVEAKLIQATREKEELRRKKSLDVREKKQVLDKYLLTEERHQPLKKKPTFSGKGKPLGKATTKKNSQKSTVYFRDGVKVGHEKYTVIPNSKNEWDGGSRGVVKSKGKRGVGFY